MTLILPPSVSQPSAAPSGDPALGVPGDAVARAEAAGRAFEAAFLAEMLRLAGVAKPPAQFGGGAGEDQFAPFLTQAYAERIAEIRPLGIGEAVTRALLARASAERAAS